MFDFFYGIEARQYAFYSVPQLLFVDDKFKEISCEAKLLYGFLLDRASLSKKNGWYDSDGKVFVFFTLDELCEKLNIGSQKAVKVFNELDASKGGIGLIKRKKQGQGKPTKIYVMNFTKYIENTSEKKEVDDSRGDKSQTCENHKSETEQSQVLTCENQKSGIVKTTSLDFRKSQAHIISKTDRTILIESNQSYPSKPTENHKCESQKSDKIDTMDANKREYYKSLLKNQIDYDWWVEAAKNDWRIKEKIPMVDELLAVMLDVICSKKLTIRIHQEEMPTETVKSVFLQLRQQHIEYVIDSFEKNSKEVKNPRAYILTALYNSISTYNHASQFEVNNLMATGGK